MNSEWLPAEKLTYEFINPSAAKDIRQTGNPIYVSCITKDLILSIFRTVMRRVDKSQKMIFPGNDSEL